jgi:hypothetical protein
MDGHDFARTIGKRVGSAVAATLLIPIVLYGSVFACGMCGILVMMGVPAASATILGSLIVSMIRPCLARARQLGFPAAAGLVVPALLFADWQFLSGLVWLVAAQVRMTIFGAPIPMFALLALCIVILMTVARPPAGEEHVAWERYQVAGLFAAAGLAIVTLAGVIASATNFLLFAAGISGGLGAGLWLISVGVIIRNFAVWVAGATMLPLAWIILSEMRSTGGGSAPPGGAVRRIAMPNAGSDRNRAAFGRRTSAPPRP